MRVYHRTSYGKKIIEEGFRDGQGNYGLIGVVVKGVFVSDVPVDANEGASGRNLLEIEIPRAIFEEYEIAELDDDCPKRYGESVIPASTLNGYPRRLVPYEEEWDLPFSNTDL
jgi:hypothetical protein